MTKGERIKLLREKANMTQEELAKLLNTTKQTIYKYEQSVVTNIPSKEKTKKNILRGKPNIEDLAKAPSISCIFACKEEKASPQKRNILRGKKNILRGKPKPQTRIK